MQPAVVHAQRRVEKERVLSVRHRSTGEHRRRPPGVAGKLEGRKQKE